MSYPNVRISLAVAAGCLLSAPPLRAEDPPATAAALVAAAAGTGTAASGTAASGAAAAGTAATDDVLPTVVVTAQKLNEKRAGIETQTGASTYTIDDAAIAATPGGDNTLLNQVIMQAPDVAQDSFGQFHVRGDHNDLQYRLNGIILPEGISVFGQSLSPRLISSLKLITGALPAEYGLRTAGIIDMTTKSGVLEPGGSVSVYGGSHGTFEPSVDYGGSSGNLNYFVSADMLRNDLGIESPDGSSNPIHDHSAQYHGFGYFEDILDEDDRLSLIIGTSNDKFQIPNQTGLEPSLGLDVNGQTSFASAELNENQRELTSYAILSWQHTQGALDWQSSVTSRYSSLTFEPDALGDLLYNGIAQSAYKRDVAFGWQSDAAYKLNDSHTARAGLYLQHDDATSATGSLVLPTGVDGLQTSDVPLAIADNGSQTQWIESAYLQDEWTVVAPLTINYGLRFDHYNAYSSGSQLSPRINTVWQAATGTTVHAGFSRYFTPPPFELVGSETISKFVNTTAAPSVAAATPPVAERSSYFDVGVQQKLSRALTLGLDSYYRRSQNLIDEGQFGAPIILTPFNYLKGKIEGVEFTGNYAISDFTAYGNLAFQSAKGRDIESAQFNFSQAELAYIADNYIHLDHEQRATASAGASYLWDGTRFSADMLFGTGLRADLVLGDGSTIPNGAHLPTYTQVNFGINHAFQFTGSGALTVRFDVINVFDKVYEIRNGTGVGVGAPQFGARRGFFGGVSKEL
jgi:outer membrane receptor protein involved in Fe transport